MKTVIFSVRPLKETIADVNVALKSSIAQETAQISFATLELMLTVLTSTRWEILKALCGTGPVTFQQAAELVGRDVKAVHADLIALINAGVVDREAGGGVFPYEDIKGDYGSDTSLGLPEFLQKA
jgi:predicted transcriptional regulator